MALIQIPPAEAQVRWDRSANRPATVHWGGRLRHVLHLDAVRDERAAYPAARGPRVTFVLRMEEGSRASLVFDGREKRWFVEAIEQAA